MATKLSEDYYDLIQAQVNNDVKDVNKVFNQALNPVVGQNQPFTTALGPPAAVPTREESNA